MSRDRAAYMREYRRQKRGRPSLLDKDAGSSEWTIARAAARILELEAEVAHLNRILAMHHGGAEQITRPEPAVHRFRPVPKPVRKGK